MINFKRSYSADEIIRAFKKYDTVSFDIFDTLIKRCVARPRDVFHRVARDFTDKTWIFIDPLKFQNDRHNAEIFAENHTSGREETNLREIYACLPEEYSSMTDELIPLEIERELKCCRPDPVMKNVYRWCRDNHKRIFIISDMYLPVEVIREMLSSCGYEGYEKLYLSSDVGLRKTTGNIFRHFITDSGINPKRHIHIGDGWRGDYLRAIQAGLRAYKITRYPARSKYTKTRGLKPECREQYAKYQAVIDNHISPECNEYYRYGFEVIGLMLYGLCCWLHERFTDKGHDKVFFLARDGYIMQEAYKRLFGENALNNSYLYVSKKLLRLSTSHDKFSLVAKYLRQEGFSGSVGIVDIGWVGHIQKYLREYPFTKKAGSVKGYTRNNDGSISPILEEYEFAGSEDEKIIGEIQRGALDFVSVMRDGYGYEHVDYSVTCSKLWNANSLMKKPGLHKETRP